MEGYQMIGFIGLDNPDRTMTFNVPLYVKVTELNKNGNSEQATELMHKVSTLMREHYESQLSEYIAKLKSKQGGQSDGFCGNAANSNKRVSDEKLYSLSDSRHETRPRA